MKLQNITVGEYCYLNEDERERYDFAIKFSEECKPRDLLNFGDITKKTFGEVKDLQQMASEPNYFEQFIKKFEEALKYNIIDFFACFNYVTEQINRINTIESQLLGHESTPDEEAAGLDRFKKLGVGIQIDSLSNGQIWLYETIRNLPYEECLFKLVLEKTKVDYQNEYIRIINSKHQNNG